MKLLNNVGVPISKNYGHIGRTRNTDDITFCQNIFLLQWISANRKSMKYEGFQTTGKHNSYVILKFKNEVHTL